jgi:hypothetical protein
MLTASQFMLHFDWALVDPAKPWRSINYTGIFVQDQMWVAVTEREG